MVSACRASNPASLVCSCEGHTARLTRRDDLALAAGTTAVAWAAPARASTAAGAVCTAVTRRTARSGATCTEPLPATRTVRSVRRSC